MIWKNRDSFETVRKIGIDLKKWKKSRVLIKSFCYTRTNFLDAQKLSGGAKPFRMRKNFLVSNTTLLPSFFAPLLIRNKWEGPNILSSLTSQLSRFLSMVVIIPWSHNHPHRCSVAPSKVLNIKFLSCFCPTAHNQGARLEGQVLIDLYFIFLYFSYLIALNTWRSHGQYVQSRAQLVCRFTGGTHHTYDEKGRYIYFLEEIICFCIEKRIIFMPAEKKSLKWQKLYSHFRCWAQVPPSSHSQSVPHYCKPSQMN